jgi:hypothetical protein
MSLKISVRSCLSSLRGKFLNESSSESTESNENGSRLVDVRNRIDVLMDEIGKLRRNSQSETKKNKKQEKEKEGEKKPNQSINTENEKKELICDEMRKELISLYAEMKEL